MIKKSLRFFLILSLAGLVPLSSFAGIKRPQLKPAPLPKAEYFFTKEPIDVVIPCAKKDLVTLELCIEGIKSCVKDLRRVIVISSEPYTENAEWFDERLYPFTKEDLGYQIYPKDERKARSFAAKCPRSGWIYQQLLKFYAPLVIPDVSSNVLIVDADVIFYRPITFIDEESGAGLYNPSKEYYRPYFFHMARLLPGLGKVYPAYSGISHHMLFQKCVIEDLFTLVEERHNLSFWQALCRCVDPREVEGSCFSEYEIYFNFVFSRTDQVKIRPLFWMNSSDFSENVRRQHSHMGLDYVAYQTYMR